MVVFVVERNLRDIKYFKRFNKNKIFKCFRWVEVWLRKRRQYICKNYQNMVPFSDPDYRCREADDDLRTAKCANKNNQSVIEVMKTEIECGWSSSCKNIEFSLLIGTMLFFIISVIY